MKVTQVVGWLLDFSHWLPFCQNDFALFLQHQLQYQGSACLLRIDGVWSQDRGEKGEEENRSKGSLGVWGCSRMKKETKDSAVEN